MLQLFAGFPQIQVIDLDAAMNRGSNSEMLAYIAKRVSVRAGGGVRTVDRARELVDQGACKVIVGTAAFDAGGPNTALLKSLRDSIGADRLTVALDSKGGRIVVKGWQEATQWSAKEVMRDLEPFCSGFLCTYVDKEGMLQGTDLEWFRDLRAATDREIIAAGGITTMDDVRSLLAMNINCAIGMAIYTGKLGLGELRGLNQV
jgi:phosphoribosylformimino-5-aminoimidazole carboxamide ribonucleotide (ProFAR) isomerase